MKIVGWSKEESMAIYEKLLLVVAAVNCSTIDLSNRDLAEVPSNIVSFVTTLNLRHNIKGVNATSLMPFRDLLILNRAYNEVHYISEEAFDHNPKLSELYLDGNKIDSMTLSFGAAHSSLTVINWWGALTPRGTHSSNFSRCVNLQKINIGYNGYQTLDASILPTSLIDLNLKYNNLETFPDIAYQTPYIKILELVGNSISSTATETIRGLKH